MQHPGALWAINPLSYWSFWESMITKSKREREARKKVWAEFISWPDSLSLTRPETSSGILMGKFSRSQQSPTLTHSSAYCQSKMQEKKKEKWHIMSLYLSSGLISATAEKVLWEIKGKLEVRDRELINWGSRALKMGCYVKSDRIISSRNLCTADILLLREIPPDWIIFRYFIYLDCAKLSVCMFLAFIASDWFKRE